jgi:prolyl oligopeptidase PreP (S9A serine peptidase family)
MLNKRNTFTDFIAAADALVARGYAARDRLVIEGGSAGGLLMGAVLNLRPDLARAALLRVPFVDVINTMLDESLPLTVGEFEEWGNPKIREHYDSMKTYCPYTNLGPRAEKTQSRWRYISLLRRHPFLEIGTRLLQRSDRPRNVGKQRHVSRAGAKVLTECGQEFVLVRQHQIDRACQPILAQPCVRRALTGLQPLLHLQNREHTRFRFFH